MLIPKGGFVFPIRIDQNPQRGSVLEINQQELDRLLIESPRKLENHESDWALWRCAICGIQLSNLI